MGNASELARIGYPTLAERLHEIRTRERWSNIARRIGVEEQTVIAWSSGAIPNRRLRRKIEDALGYRFAERRFAEAAAEAEFPPAHAPEVIRELATHAAFHRFCAGTALRISQDRLAEFFGWLPTNFSDFLRNDRYVVDHGQLVVG